MQATIKHRAAACLALMLIAALLCGCGGPTPPSDPAPASASGESSAGESSESSQPLPDDATMAQRRQAAAEGYMPVAAGTVTYGNELVAIDASNISRGYIMAAYTGQNLKVKLRISKTGGTTYTYDLATDGSYDTFLFSEGDGSYTVNVYENIRDSSYSQAFGVSVDVALDDPLTPFLTPNQYVYYTADCPAAMFSYQLCGETEDAIERLDLIYNYVVENIVYDYPKAETVTSGYLPDVDEVLAAKTGICFDYAALMTAMLRVQGIPTRLAVGNAGTAYHAWISVYIEEIGWIDGIIEFNGTDWVRMDPTFASAGKESSNIMEFIGDGTNYTELYSY